MTYTYVPLVASDYERLEFEYQPGIDDSVFASLKDAVIVQIGMARHPHIEGGLMIDFIPQGQTEKRRIIFGFNELGMWLEYFDGLVKDQIY
jgi:hypothetical protein